ncbi:hypothetical protein P7K49_032031 [Saguinus oedipus]|uniref:Uncharacterized protein n=1 Tax=Saguinus oedipus TaxID=9490 RepID=A0ABQ9TY17_SAGOE|nr:hypothetical protein P7K49_032031 [Saguinus oedipus]
MECQNHLRRYGNVNLELVTRIIRDGGPWEDPVLQAVLKAQPASQEIGTSGDSKSNQHLEPMEFSYETAKRKKTRPPNPETTAEWGYVLYLNPLYN